MNEEGGASFFLARNSALLFNRGATVGGATLATLIVSRRLCPGTPSNVVPFARAALEVPLLDVGRGRGRAGSGALPPLMRSDAARVMRGATVGGAVDATWIVLERLWPGTSIKTCFSSSLVGATRGLAGFTVSTGAPARRAAARVVRGAMSGTSVVRGTGRALNGTPPFPDASLREPEPADVTDEGPLREPETEVPPPFVAETNPPTRSRHSTLSSSGAGASMPTPSSCSMLSSSAPSHAKSWAGKGGEDWKRHAIWSSAVCASGLPMSAFWLLSTPKMARSELGAVSRARSGSASPMSAFHTSTARRRSKTYTHTGPLIDKINEGKSEMASQCTHSKSEGASFPKSSCRNSWSESGANSICRSLTI